MRGQRLILRLDDAAERMDVEKWNRIEQLLDKYNIRPLVGVIPDCKDSKMDKYKKDPLFWDKVHRWMDKGWTIAMHGYRHVYDTDDGGINPVNNKSEFAGHSYEEQAIRIRNGLKIMNEHGVKPTVFFAPGHTFDVNTLNALKKETRIRIISDTVAWDTYYEKGFFFIPQQSGRVRKLPFRTCTFCYHPNTMSEAEFNHLEMFIDSYRSNIIGNIDVKTKRGKSLIDIVLSKAYYGIRIIRVK